MIKIRLKTINGTIIIMPPGDMINQSMMAEFRNELISIEIPEAIKLIDDATFKGFKKLKTIKIANGTELGDSVFQNCTSLTKAVVPELTTDIFKGCVALKYVDADTDYVQPHAFDGCTSLLRLNSNELKIIDRYAFRDCYAIKEITVTPRVNIIGKRCFDNCSAVLKSSETKPAIVKLTTTKPVDNMPIIADAHAVVINPTDILGNQKFKIILANKASAMRIAIHIVAKYYDRVSSVRISNPNREIDETGTVVVIGAQNRMTDRSNVLYINEMSNGDNINMPNKSLVHYINFNSRNVSTKDVMFNIHNLNDTVEFKNEVREIDDICNQIYDEIISESKHMEGNIIIENPPYVSLSYLSQRAFDRYDNIYHVIFVLSNGSTITYNKY